MRTADGMLVCAVIALGTFVAVEVAKRPAVHVPPATAPSIAAARVTTRRDTTARVAAQPHVARDSAAATGVTSTARTDLLSGAPNTYMRDMVDDLGGTLVRWPDRHDAGLRIWVQSSSAVRDWDLRYAQMARDAFAEWSDAVPFQFDFILDSASADVRIVWLDQFPPSDGRRIGTTGRTTDRMGWIVAANISVAVHDSAGRTLQPASLAGIVRHEAGHALGLGHSPDPHTKMYAEETQTGITAADRATLRLLYQVPPGRVR